jgi:hypothetical protein
MLAASTLTNKKSRAAASATETMLTCHLVMPKGDPADEFVLPAVMIGFGSRF